jgi:hypothetical protein
MFMPPVKPAHLYWTGKSPISITAVLVSTTGSLPRQLPPLPPAPPGPAPPEPPAPPALVEVDVEVEVEVDVDDFDEEEVVSSSEQPAT